MAHSTGRVLVVEDDDDLRAVLRDILSDEGFIVSETGTGTEAKLLVDLHDPDLILLDLGLPDISGLDVLADLTGGDVSVIVVSGRSGETDTVVGLDLGADDYISKPFSERELLARVNAALRRQRRQTHSELVFEGLLIDQLTRDVIVDGRLVELTPREYDVLVFFARSPRQVFNRAQLLEQVWESSPTWQDDNTVVEHIHRIRRKLDDENRSRFIQTIRRVGYRFSPQES